MTLYPRLSECKALDAKSVTEAERILEAVDKFSQDLSTGSITIEKCFILKEQNRRHHFFSLVKCLAYSRRSKPSSRIEDICRLRLEEAEKFLQAVESIREFHAKFDTGEGPDAMEALPQMCRNPLSVQLKSVSQCRRIDREPIQLNLNKISDEQLQILQWHNDIYGQSSVFAQVHDKVLNEAKG
jgi:hypothetical protein